jgi:hypothetical protein
MTKKISLLCLCLLIAQASQAQEVWPGDVNNNGIVNGADALYLGWAFGASGPARQEVDTDWEAQPAPGPWSQSFPNGLNYYFADCDGNGTVDLLDLFSAIEDNYLETRGVPGGDGFANAAPGEGPRLRLVPSSNVVAPFSQIEISLYLGDDDALVENFYGINLQLSYGFRQGSDYDDLEFTTEVGGWFDPGNSDSFTFFMEGDDKADLTISRTNQQPISLGAGKLGSFSVIMEDIIVGLQVDTFTIRIDSVFLVTDKLTALPVEADSAIIFVTDDLTSLSGQDRSASELWLVYPNPAHNLVYIQTNEIIEKAALYQLQGQEVPLQVQPRGTNTLECRWPTGLPSGLYYLQVFSKAGSHTHKIVIY